MEIAFPEYSMVLSGPRGRPPLHNEVCPSRPDLTSSGEGTTFPNMARARKKQLSEIIFVVEESPEGGFEANSLGFSIFTQAENMEELKASIRDAVNCHFPKQERPGLIRLHFVKDDLIAL